MSLRCEAGEVGGALPPTQPQSAGSAPALVRVWDPLVRLFHWALVALFATAYATSELGGLPHKAAGYGILGLLAMRVVWGLVGSKHARFSDFVCAPRAVLAYMRFAVRGRAPRHLGHNPAGGAMVLVLITMLGGIGITGHLLTTEAWWGSEQMADLHAFLVNATLVLIALHLAGNLMTSVMHRENLALSMITGRKRAG